MNRRPQLIEALKIHEGLRLVPYRDTAGKLTIGYGHNLEAKPLSWLRASSPIPKKVAELILDMDVDDALHSLDVYLPWWRTLDDVREQVLAEMAFNMGVDDDPRNGLDSFKNTLLAIREGRWREAQEGMLNSKWAGQVHGRAIELANMMLTGKA
jgi:lysozyme